MKEIFKGCGVALVTPFKNGNIDEEALVNIVDHVIDGGVDYIVALGTTGETAMLSNEEKSLVLDITKKVNNGRLPFVVGHLSGNNTKQVVKDIERFDLEGVDAILCASPAYVKPSQEGLVQHYSAVAKASHLPIIVYNVPSRTGSNLSIDSVCRIADESQNIIGIKEASGDILQGINLINKSRSDFFVTSGDDPTSMALTFCGGHGVISVIGNVYPKEFSEMIRAALDGRMVEAWSINKKLNALHPLLYVEGNPTGIKAAMEIKNLCSREVRLPLSPLSSTYLNALKEEMNKII